MLGETEREVGVESIDNVLVIGENTLGGLGAEIGDVLGFGCVVVIGKDGTDVSCKHHVEFTDGAPVFFATDGAFGVGA